MSHLVLRRINGKWRMFNKHTKKVEGPAMAHKEEAAIATHKKDIGEDKVFDKSVEEEHKEHPEFSKASAKKIAIDHEKIKAKGKKPADEKGKGGGKPKKRLWNKGFAKEEPSFGAGKGSGKMSNPEEFKKAMKRPVTFSHWTKEHREAIAKKTTKWESKYKYPPPGYSKDSAKEEAEFNENADYDRYADEQAEKRNKGRGAGPVFPGGPYRETLKESGMEDLGKTADGGRIFRDKKTGKREIWFANKRHASSGIRHRGTDWEFARSEGRGGSDMSNMTYKKIGSGVTMNKMHPIISGGRMRKHDRYATSGKGGGKGQCWAMGSGGDHSFKDGKCVHCGCKGMGEGRGSDSGDEMRAKMREQNKRYSIVRFYAPGSRSRRRVINTGLTLEQAQKHTNDPTTRKEGKWFDSYTEE